MLESHIYSKPIGNPRNFRLMTSHLKNKWNGQKIHYGLFLFLENYCFTYLSMGINVEHEPIIKFQRKD